MLTFKEYLEEKTGDKNLHMTHLEDSVLEGGIRGTRDAIDYLRTLRDMLAGASKSSLFVSTKFDGAPAVFAGIDPIDGQFFVAKKSVFAKNSKVYKTPNDVDADTSGDLADKLKLALKYLPELNIRGVIQGDFLFAKKDIKVRDINGTKYYTFHPNTIMYAVPVSSEMGKRVAKAQIGIVWHTTYEGNSFENMRAVYGKNITSTLKGSRNVMSWDAEYKDVSGSATFTDSETKELTALLSRAGKIFQKLKPATLNAIAENQELKLRIMTYINAHIRRGEAIQNVPAFVRGLVDDIVDYYQKHKNDRKTDKGKQAIDQKKNSVLTYFSNTENSQIIALFEMYNLLQEAKVMIIRKMEKASHIPGFILTPEGIKATGPEGFVAVDSDGNKSVVKLVDRLAFSHANFNSNVIKGWQR